MRPLTRKNLSTQILVLWLMMSSAAWAQEPTTAEAVDKKVTLDVTPAICVAPRGLRVCGSDMDIDWLSELAGDYCLHSRAMPPEAPPEPARELECWNDKDSGHHSEYVVMSHDLEYKIQNPGDPGQFTTAKVKIAMLKPHRKYPRRHSRWPWSVIKP